MESHHKVGAIGFICLAAIIITIIICVYKYKTNITIEAFRAGLEQGTVMGHNGWVWIKKEK